MSMWLGKRADIFYWPSAGCWENVADAKGTWDDTIPADDDMVAAIWKIELADLPKPGTCVRALVEMFVYPPE